jgi:hypothetical protein
VGKQAYRDYVQALNKWLIPYFGTTDAYDFDIVVGGRNATFFE